MHWLALRFVPGLGNRMALRLVRAVDLENAHGILCIGAEKFDNLHLVILREGLIVDTDATLWDADLYLETYKAKPLSLLVLEE